MFTFACSFSGSYASLPFYPPPSLPHLRGIKRKEGTWTRGCGKELVNMMWKTEEWEGMSERSKKRGESKRTRYILSTRSLGFIIGQRLFKALSPSSPRVQSLSFQTRITRRLINSIMVSSPRIKPPLRYKERSFPEWVPYIPSPSFQGSERVGNLPRRKGSSRL